MQQKVDPIPIFLNDSGGIKMLEEMILGKSSDHSHLEKKKHEIVNSDLYSNVQGEIRAYFLERVFNVKYGNEFESLERELRNLTYIYRKATNPVLEESEWDKKYEYATEQVRISDVVSHFLNPKSLKRNIKCCFHDEKTPSLRIYEKDNRFVCFGCGARGSPIDFVMKYKNYDFSEAVEFINTL